MRKLAIGLLVQLTLCFVSVANGLASTLRVPADYLTINAALDASVLGDTVLVAPGVYTEAESRTVPWGSTFATFTSAAFLKDGVSLVAADGPSATTLDLSGIVGPVGSVSGIVGAGLASGETVVDGFRIVSGGFPQERGIEADAGSALLTVRDCVIEGFDATPLTSAAISHMGTALSVLGCVIKDCRGDGGGAIGLVNVNLIVEDTVFEDNEAVSGSGGAILLRGDTNDPVIFGARIERCRFVGNRAGASGGAVAKSRASYRSIEIIDSVFLDNSAPNAGAADVALTASFGTGVISGCVFAGNAATGPGSLGGALLVSRGVSEISNSTFYGNSSVSDGGAFGLDRSSATVSRNIVAGSLGSGAAIFGFMLFSVVTECNVLWDNVSGHVEGLSLSGTDREADPAFCDAAGGDFLLRSDSPCLPPNLGCGLIGALEEGCGGVSVETVNWTHIKSLYRSEE